MTPASTRVVRGALLLLILGVGGSVAWQVRNHAARGATASPSPGAGTDPSKAPTTTEPPRPDAPMTEDIVYREFAGDRVKFVLTAKKMIGKQQEQVQLSQVTMTFSYKAQGQAHTATISADECTHTPHLQKAAFRGNVLLKTDDKLELRSGGLVYRGDKQQASADGNVAFSRKAISGTAKGMEFDAVADRLLLESEVVILLRDPDDPPMDIHAGKAEIDRTAGVMKFTGGVSMKQGNDQLTSQRLVVDIAGVGMHPTRAQAVENVDLQTTGGPLPGTTGGTGGNGPRRIQCWKLDMHFQGNRTLQEAVATEKAVFTAWAAPGEPPEKRTIQAEVLTFRFDPTGRLSEVQAQRDASFASAPVAPAKGAPRNVKCQSFLASFDPASGAVKQVEFRKDVVFTQGAQRASAGVGWFDGKKSMLILKEDPHLVDAAQGSDLKANAIDIVTTTGDVVARHDVKHVLQPKDKTAKGLLGGAPETITVTSKFFDYAAATRTAKYREGALLKSGASEIRGKELVVQQDAAGKRRLEATGEVASAMSSPAAKGKPAPAPIVGRAGKMVYEEATGQVVYSGDALIRQGEMQTKSPQATIVLAPDGGGLKSLVAGDPVEVQQGLRKASGGVATFTPAAKTMVITGENVVVDDLGQQLRGRSVTFHMGEDRVTVDGREARTEIRIQKAIPTVPVAPPTARP